METIRTLEELEALYAPAPLPTALLKEVPRLIPEYRQLVEAAPFVALATVGPEGLDCSPRGDLAGFARVLDDTTLALPDRRGNNRIDSLRNVVRDPRVALLFLIPGSGTTFRVNGRAVLTADEAMRASFAVDGKSPRTVMLVTVESCYFQCSRAIIRSELWNPERHVDPAKLPTPGQIQTRVSQGEVDGAAYDREWPERARLSLW
jgi:PPOX class probable FMN-dependent enzyme